MSRGNKNVLGNASFEREEQGRGLSVKRMVGGLAIMGTLGVGGLVLAGAASADTGNTINVVVGGATNSDSSMFLNTLVSSGAVNPNSAIPVNYPAEMGPIVGSTPTDQSVAVGVANVEQIVRDHPGANVVLRGFSEGDFVTNGAAADLASQGINVSVVNAGDGNGATGILNNPLAETFQPIVQSLGIYKTPPVPGTVELADGNDVWAATANGQIGDLINDGLNIPTFHRVPGPNEVPVQDFNVGGVEYKIYGNPIVEPEGALDLPLSATDPNAVPAPAPEAVPADAPAPAPEVAPADDAPAPADAPVDAPAPDAGN